VPYWPHRFSILVKLPSKTPDAASPKPAPRSGHF